MNRLWVIFIGLGLLTGHAQTAPYALLISGSGGQQEYRARFDQWSRRLQAVLTDSLQHPPDHILRLTETTVPPVSTQTIGAALDQLGQRLTPADDLFVYLIGHGSFRDNAAKLQIPGPDLSAAALDSLLAQLAVGRVILINAASASAPFINALSAPGRILCTSTKSAEERDAPWFMEYLIQGLENGSADRNRDGRITVLEACGQGAALTQAYYQAQRLIATEHALLDDNGDGLGTRLPLPLEEQTEGTLAATVFLKDFRYPPNTPPHQINAYRAALAQVEAHIRRKPELPENEYYQRLEELLLVAARIHRTIREPTD